MTETETEIRGLSVRRPWSPCIVTGAKPFENRSKKIAYRGWLAIHSSLRGFDEMALMSWRVRQALADAPSITMVPGAIIGTARLVGCHEPGPACDPYWCQADAPWHWELADASPLETPIFRAGALSLWRLTDDEDVQVREHIRDYLAGKR